ncbi:MAG: SGNH/GDSL hydrolase family protein [Cellvibrio sp.]
MKKINLAICSLLCAAVFANAEGLSKPLPVHTVGRVVEEKSGKDQVSYTYSWPGVYFEAAFKGTAVDVKLDDDQNFLNIIVDDQQPILLKKPGKIVYSVKNLSPGDHKIRLEKLTETQWSKGKFEGFYVSGKDSAIKVPEAKRKIEFIGDSFTVGYGNTSSSRDCTTEQVFETTNTQLAFAPRVAKHFKADYQINASSGFGVVRNYNGGNPDKSLLKLYPYTLYDTSSVYKDKWKPQVIVIGLGTNDFSTPLNAGERWTSREALQADYVENYKKFIKDLRAKHKKAYFILNASNNHDGEIAKQVEKVITQLKADGEKRIDSLIFSGLDYGGCHWHPSVKDDEILTKLFIEKIESNPGIWK